jgi:hypothetical protein
MIVRKRSIDLLNRISFASLEIKAVWGCKHRGAEQVLLSKWLFKLMNEDGQWQQILRKKYLTNQTLGTGSKEIG